MCSEDATEIKTHSGKVAVCFLHMKSHLCRRQMTITWYCITKEKESGLRCKRVMEEFRFGGKSTGLEVRDPEPARWCPLVV